MKSISVSSSSSSSSSSSWKQPADRRERHRTSTASIRCDFIMNLDPFMRREGGSAATTEEESRDVSAKRPSSVLPRPSSTTTTTQSQLRRRLKMRDDRSSGSTVTNDVCVKANRGGRKGGRAVEHDGIGAAGSRGAGGGRRLISREDDPSIRTYPLRVVDQLRVCEHIQKYKDGDGVLFGFECIHCRRISGGRQERFRRFPKTPQEVTIELSNFRMHLNSCRGVPSDLRSYLSWMERRWSSHRMQRAAPSIAGHIMRRLKAGWDEDRSSTPSNDAAKRSDERMKLERMKRIHTKRRHSVLENIELLA